MTCRKCGSERVRALTTVDGDNHTSDRQCLECGAHWHLFWQDPPKMAPGQTPYTPEEQQRLSDLIDGACEDDPGEENEPRSY